MPERGYVISAWSACLIAGAARRRVPGGREHAPAGL